MMGLPPDVCVDTDATGSPTVYFEIFPAYEEGLSGGVDLLYDLCMSMAAPLMTGYVWQQQSFQLRSSMKETPPWRPARPLTGSRNPAKQSQEDLSSFREGQLPCLWGTVEFGDNLEDEWFITWLLQQLTLRIPGTAARVWDNDGEFLLIEAAYALPRWLKPETSINRVWLAGGQLHIVPLPSSAAPSIPSFPTLTQALQLVRSEHVSTLAGSKAQAAIYARLHEFPAGRHKHMHRARVAVPSRVAAVLAAEPQLVAPAVEAFHYRDLDDMRAAARMQHFPPQDMASVVVTFSRCLYAQLEQQQFEPPKGYTLPPPDSATFHAAQLGMKLSCGFEMLYSRRQHHAAPAGTDKDQEYLQHASLAGSASAGASHDSKETLSEERLAGNPSWEAFKKSLERNGYFKGNIPGSQQHREMTQAAVQSFAAMGAYKRSAAALAAPVLRMQEILRQPPSREQLEKEMQGAEDDDSWMRDGAAELERELAARQKEMEGAAGGKTASNGFDPQDLVERMKAFVEKQASFEGAEVPACKGASAEGVSFNSKRFFTELSAALGMQPGDTDPFLADLASDSDEGSSFFGGASEDADEDGDDRADVGDDAPDVYRAQREERAQHGQAFHTHKAEASSAAAAGVLKPAAEPGRGSQQHSSDTKRSDAVSNGAPSAAQSAAAALKPPAMKRGFLNGAGPAPADDAGPSRAARAAETASKPAPSAARASEAAARQHSEDWEVLTATDSDDEVAGDPEFMAEYEDRMDRELAHSKVGGTFERTPLQSGPAATAGGTSATADPSFEGRDKAAAAADAEDTGAAPGFVGARRPVQPSARRTGEAVGEEEEDEEELQPVDVDLNLVQNLLASYAGQHGLPGPVSNLAGLLGLRLPDEEHSSGGGKKESEFDASLS